MKSSNGLFLLMMLSILGGTQLACKESAKEPSSKAIDKNRPSDSESEGKGDDGDGGREGEASWARGLPSNLVKQADLKIGQRLKAMKAEDIREYMAETGAYYDTEPDEDDEDDKCTSDLLSGVPIKATKSSVSAHIEVDLARCADKDGVKFSSFKMIMDFAVACEHGDLAKLDGKTFGELDSAGEKAADPAKCDDGKTMEISRSASTYVGTQQLPEGAFVMEGAIIEALSTASGAPCEATIAKGRKSFVDGCQKLTKTSYLRVTLDGQPQPSQGEEDVKLRIYNGLVALTTNDALWYEKGAMDVRINGWKGKVTYGGATQAPTFEVTSEGGERVTGKVGAAGGTALGLTGTALRGSVPRPVSAARARLERTLRGMIGP